jgi:hypothetical protein
VTACTQLSGAFAIGTFSASEAAPFPGLVVGDRVLDLRSVAGLAALAEGPPTSLDLLDHWGHVLPQLHLPAQDTGHDYDWQPLKDLRVHAPVQPRQVFQSGANYRQHVIDLEVAHRSRRPAHRG